MPRTLFTSVTFLVFAAPACAAPLDGAALSWPWALPFIGILLTIAIAPLLEAFLQMARQRAKELV